MGLYRTKPEEVEAVQFKLDESPAFSNGNGGPDLPSWLWNAITSGADNGGISFHEGYPYLKGRVGVNHDDWIVNGGRNEPLVVLSEGDFKSRYSPVRKRLYTEDLPKYDPIDIDESDTEEGNV